MKKQRNQAKQPKNRKASADRSDSFTFSDHIRELRRRIFWVALVFMVTSSLAYSYHDVIIQVVMAPLDGEKLIYLTPGGGFSFIFQVTLYAGMIAAGPILIHQIYGFLRPILPEYARRYALRVTLSAIILMVAGVAYGYFVAVPNALNFLSTFAGTEIIPNLTADSYLSFFLAYIGGLALLFMLPLFLIFWHWIKPMKPGGLLKSERYIVLFAFVAAALITPTPDVVNQAMIAVPLIGIYQIGVVTVLLLIWRDRKQQTNQTVTKVSSTAKKPLVTLPVPQPVIIQPTSPQAVVTAPIVRPQATARSLDGFRTPVTAQHAQPRHPATRPLTVPTRPSPSRESLLNRRPMLRIDGVSPL